MDDAGCDLMNTDGPQWDEAVDVLCYGSGLGVWASAVAAVDADNSVLVIRPRAATASGAVLLADVTDEETRAYLDALVADAGAPEGVVAEALAIAAVTEAEPADTGAPIEPFYGARLLDWAGRCLVSAYGVLYTRLPDQAMTAMKSPAGEEIQVRTIGALDPEVGDDVCAAVDAWLAAQVRDREVDVLDGALQRLVFEDGRVIGAVVTTADGVRSVQVRHGIAMSTGVGADDAEGAAFTTADPVRVALVGRSASRFGRIELLTSQPVSATGTAVYCRSRRVHDGLRGAGRSVARRCPKIHRYPPLA